jgi:DNA-binding LacI/PurR family transcriptional regulator
MRKRHNVRANAKTPKEKMPCGRPPAPARRDTVQMPSPNMAEIARIAGVGKATVSLALRNDPRLRPETRRHIQVVAKRLGYKSNAVVSNLMAQLRASKDPKYQATLALINVSPDKDYLHTNPTFSAVTEGVIARTKALGYGINEFWLYEPDIDPERLAQILRARNIRGAVIAAMTQHLQLPTDFDPVWPEISCVTVGIRPEHPAFHFSCNDQFSTAHRLALRLLDLGYEKPGLVIDPLIERVIDHRFSAGFFAGGTYHSVRQQIPLHPFTPDGKAAFHQWLSKYSPDVIVTTHGEIRPWLQETSLKCPKQIGLAHLDINKGLEGWSGMNQKNDLVGASAIDLLVGQIHRNETGIPDSPKSIMTESEWVPGKTLRR